MLKKNYSFIQLSIKDIRANNVFVLFLFYFKTLFYLYFLHVWLKLHFSFIHKYMSIKLHSFDNNIIKFNKFTILRSPFVNKKAREHFEFKYINFDMYFSLVSKKIRLENSFNHGSRFFLYGKLYNFLCFGRGLSAYNGFVNIFKKLLYPKSIKALAFLLLLFSGKALILGNNNSKLLRVKPLFFSFFNNYTNASKGLFKLRFFIHDVLRFYIKCFFSFLIKSQLIFSIKTYHKIDINIYRGNKYRTFISHKPI